MLRHNVVSWQPLVLSARQLLLFLTARRWRLGTGLRMGDGGPRDIGTLDISTVALLASAFFGLDEEVFAEFLVTFADMSQSIAARSTFGMFFKIDPEVNNRIECTLVLQHHLRHFKPVKLVEDQATSAKCLRLVIERQVAKIPRIPQVITQSGRESQSDEDLCLQERAVSVSLVVFPCGTFRLIVLGDEGVYVEHPLSLHVDRRLWDRIGIYPWSSGKGAGVSHFLVALFLLLEAWHRSWNKALVAIDGVISFEASAQIRFCQVLGVSVDKLIRCLTI